MQKAEPQQRQTQHRPAQRPGGVQAESPQGEQIARLDALMQASPAMVAQRKLFDMIHSSPRQAAQRVAAHEAPAQLNALAYARGTDIHVAPGQEQHLPHEAWHVVQQAQGRVQPTMQLKDGVAVNDAQELEREADVMGIKSLQFASKTFSKPEALVPMGSSQTTIQRVFDEAITPIEKAIQTLAYSTAAGRAAMEIGQGKLSAEESSDWKTLTRGGRIGIGIPKAAFDILKSWAGDGSKVLVDKDKYAVLIAHELTHLRHFMMAPGTFAVRGQRANWLIENGWDADPEEELTVKGMTRVSVDKWEEQYGVAVKDSGINELQRQKEADTKEVEEIRRRGEKVPPGYTKRLKEIEEKIAAIQLDKKPKYAIESNGFYIFKDENNENLARKEKGFQQRKNYADASFKPESSEHLVEEMGLGHHHVPQPYPAEELEPRRVIPQPHPHPGEEEPRRVIPQPYPHPGEEEPRRVIPQPYPHPGEEEPRRVIPQPHPYPLKLK